MACWFWLTSTISKIHFNEIAHNTQMNSKNLLLESCRSGCETGKNSKLKQASNIKEPISLAMNQHTTLRPHIINTTTTISTTWKKKHCFEWKKIDQTVFFIFRNTRKLCLSSLMHWNLFFLPFCSLLYLSVWLCIW